MGPALSVIYVSYDRALDALGASQVVLYLLGLAKRGFAATLISFEKRERWRRDNLRSGLHARLDGCSIRWRPGQYHKRRPRLPATLRDILVGSRVIRFEARRSRPAVAMARWAGLSPSTRLLYDVRRWAEIRSVEPGAVAEWLRRARTLFFIITTPIPGFASGLPVVCNRGIGDLDDVVEQERVGVPGDDFSEAAYLAAARRLGRLLEDPSLSWRRRRLAETRYSVDLGVDAYRQLYDEIMAGVALSNCERGGVA
jgi:glycosyltransferase involved in cell wall biosynthesis